jgi:hypothetical protein
MVMSENKAVVGKFELPTYLHALGWLATFTMFLASSAFFFQIPLRPVLIIG